ncbi:MAG TPA: helix-hairpin-helix domain-containing protein [Methylomirabilota bacterium]|nr:helix-hairpin-helix domain-containing protein [Methylomirabilota bacterium]
MQATAETRVGAEARRHRPAVGQEVAEKLRQAAALLGQQGASPSRVAAYRRAAETLGRLGRDLRDIVDRDDLEGLIALPHIGCGIAGAIDEILRTGRWSLLERLRGTLDPVRVFRTIPGLGGELAQRIPDILGIDTLEALERAAHDGRLESVPGVGPRRAATIRAALAVLLGRTRAGVPPLRGPGVPMLLDVDREYRERAQAGSLRTIAPRRFNLAGAASRPVLHVSRDGWHFTVLYANTARAHALGRTRDRVVVYCYDNQHREGQSTVVTETQGPLHGRRVVRGREEECREVYASEGTLVEEGTPLLPGLLLTAQLPSPTTRTGRPDPAATEVETEPRSAA